MNGNTVEDTDLDRTPTHEEISALAHHFYEQEGCPDGLAQAHWFAAEERFQEYP